MTPSSEPTTRVTSTLQSQGGLCNNTLRGWNHKAWGFAQLCEMLLEASLDSLVFPLTLAQVSINLRRPEVTFRGRTLPTK
jgi:hypothetical protein